VGVVRTVSNVAEPLLASRVPYLQLETLALNLDRLDLEVDANVGIYSTGRTRGFTNIPNGHLVAPVVVVVAEAHEQRGLAHGCTYSERVSGVWRARRGSVRGQNNNTAPSEAITGPPACFKTYQRRQ